MDEDNNSGDSALTDRELLELAANAAGIKVFSYIDSEFFGRGINTGEVDDDLWNPLTDDGDALRLAMLLGLTVNPYDRAVFVSRNENESTQMQMLGDDRYAAARRAIVRAAAEIERNKSGGA